MTYYHLNHLKTADTQAHNTALSATLRACRSAISEKNCVNDFMNVFQILLHPVVLKPLQVKDTKNYIYFATDLKKTTSFQGLPEAEIRVTKACFGK